MYAFLLRAEDTVARIAQTGDDVAVLVEVAVQRSAVDLHVGMSHLKSLLTNTTSYVTALNFLRAR